MGLMEKLFFRNWPRPLDTRGRPDLALDLYTGAVGSFQVNSKAESLKEKLGPPASWNRWRNRGAWHYPELGIWFETSKAGMIESIHLVSREGDQYEYCPGWKGLWKPWTGSIRFPDGTRVPALDVKPDHFISYAGEPDQRDDDPDGNEFIYCDPPRFSNFGFDVEFTAGGEFSGLELYSTRD